MTDPKLTVHFLRTAQGNEPVREWLKELPSAERKAIGDAIRTVQFGWPIGMPLGRKLDAGLWDVRERLKDRIARVLFTIVGGEALLLHGFIKRESEDARAGSRDGDRAEETTGSQGALTADMKR